MTVPERYYLGLSPYLRNTGLAYEVGPIRNPNGEVGVNLDKMYTNITEKWQWGGLDKVDDPSKYILMKQSAVWSRPIVLLCLTLPQPI